MISPAMMSSGMNASPLANRSPITSMAALQSARMPAGVGPFRQQAVDHGQGIVFPEVDDGLRQFLCHSSSLGVPAGVSFSTCASPM